MWTVTLSFTTILNWSIKYIILRPNMHILPHPPSSSPLPLLWVNHRLTMLSPLMEPSPPLWGENWRGAASALFTLDLHFLRFGSGWVFEGYSELWRSSKAFITRPLWNGKRLSSRSKLIIHAVVGLHGLFWFQTRKVLEYSKRELYFVNIIFKATVENTWNRSQMRKV